MALLFENDVCGRCSGTGNFSRCEMYGTMCFKCGGTGAKLTKRGALAQEFYTDSLSIKDEDVKVGMRLRAGNQVFTVTEITENYTHSKSCMHGKGTNFFKYPNGEEKQNFINLALQYQESITKAGLPKKRSKS
tara:strand:+ start:366 stop:764 length:399 start_codon:yes stop_codon:yes gene_type:complete